MAENGPIFVISDLHLGDGGFRDNFARGTTGNREQQLRALLDYVGTQRGELVIIGDLFEFWQTSLGQVLLRHRLLLDRFSEMRAVYVVGNHDVDLEAFIGTDFLCHPFFGRMGRPFERVIDGKRFKFMHGHEVDPFNCGDAPSWGRIFSIIAGMFEDHHKSPLLPSGETVEAVLEEFAEDMLRLWNSRATKLTKPEISAPPPNPQKELTPAQNPDRVQEMYRRYREDREANGYDVAIVGHTHLPGRLGNWYYNSGTWTGQSNNFLRISPAGDVEVFDWTETGAVPNPTVLDG
jgi:UDP-2,3-diacylglucosamine pyrophosphatase LpxH